MPKTNTMNKGNSKNSEHFEHPENLTVLILRALRLGWTPAAIAQMYGPKAGERALEIMLEMISE